MQVKVKCLVTGREKVMDKRHADILVKMKRATYQLDHAEESVVEETPVKTKVVKEKKTKDLVADGEKKKGGRPKKQTYQTKDVVAE